MPELVPKVKLEFGCKLCDGDLFGEKDFAEKIWRESVMEVQRKKWYDDFGKKWMA